MARQGCFDLLPVTAKTFDPVLLRDCVAQSHQQDAWHGQPVSEYEFTKVFVGCDENSVLPDSHFQYAFVVQALPEV